MKLESLSSGPRGVEQTDAPHGADAGCGTMATNGMRKIKLKEVCERITVGHVGPMADKYTSEGVPFLRSQNITPFQLNLDDIKFIPQEFHQKLSKSALRAGDVAVVRTGYPGTACVIPDSFKELNCADLVVITPAKDLNPYYLAAIFNSAWGMASVAGNLVGVAQQHFNIGAARELEVQLPPRKAQDRIAGILSAYDELIENSQRRIRILETMARALYREWFVHFRFPGHENHPRVPSPLGDIPQGWAATTLGEFVSSGSISLQTGPFGTQLKASQYTDEGTPVINVRNIGSGVLKADKLEFLPPERAEEHKRHKLLEGDIVFGRKGAVERHLLVSPSEQGWIQGSDCIRLRVVSGPLTPRYLSVRFREEDHQRWMMNQCSGGATMASLNQDILCRIPLVVPAREHLAAFDRFCASTLNQMDVLSSQIQNLRRTRDLLLPRLLSGQVNLKEE